jgi:DNA repair and recombination RAD54-like protein
MIRRTSAVLQALLPAKVEQVVFCKMSPLQLKLYNHFLESPAVRNTLAGAPPPPVCLAGPACVGRRSASDGADAPACLPL